MPLPFFPNEATLYSAKDWQGKLANSKVRLFKASLNAPSPTTTRVELLAAECDYDGYAAKVVAAWLNPLESDQGGHQISAPTQQFEGGAPFAVANMVGGYWIETVAVVGPPAVPETVIIVRKFDIPVSVGAAQTGVQVTPTIVVPNG